MNIYVGNLDYSVLESELNELFGQYGKVSTVTIVKDRFTGKGKGFGFVEMDDKNEANEAIRNINNSTLNARKIVVNEARARD